MKIKAIAFFVLCLASCKEPRWAWSGSGLTRPVDMCGLAAGSDALVFGRIVAAERTPRVMTFSTWPDDPVKVSVLTVEVDRDVKGLIPAGSRVTMLISASLASDTRSVNTIRPSPLGVGGWLALTGIDGHWLGDIGGLAYDTDPGPRHVSHLGSFESDDVFEARLSRALLLCPRYDFNANDGGIPDGGYAVWAAEELAAREAREAEAYDAGIGRDAGR